MSEGGDQSAPVQPGLIPLSHTTQWDAFVTTTLSQQGRDVWEFLEQAWIAHHRGAVMPSQLSDP